MTSIIHILFVNNCTDTHVGLLDICWSIDMLDQQILVTIISSWSLHISIYHISTWHISSWFSCYMLIGLDSVVCSIISMPICSHPLDIISVQIPSIIHHKCTQMRLEVEEHYHMQSILWSLRGSKDCTSSIVYRCNEDWLLLLNISCMFLWNCDVYIHI